MWLNFNSSLSYFYSQKSKIVIDACVQEKSRLQAKGLTVYHDPQIANSSIVHCSRETQTEDAIGKNENSLREEDLGEESGGDSAYFDQEAFNLMANGKSLHTHIII